MLAGAMLLMWSFASSAMFSRCPTTYEKECSTVSFFWPEVGHLGAAGSEVQDLEAGAS